MVIILADSSVGFHIPRQLIEINGEPLVARTIRLLKENGVKDIIVTAHDKRFEGLGATRYEPKNNSYDPANHKGYWLDAFPLELLTEPTIYLMGDVYFSEKAIKTILETPTDGVLFFCTHNNESIYYIKHHDEPLAYKVTDIELFKKHIDIVKKLKDEGKTGREPVTWELYRNLNGLDVNVHQMTENYVAINDESCDIDSYRDIPLLESKIGGNIMIKVTAISDFTLGDFDKLKNIKRIDRDIEGKLYKGDIFECDVTMANYLLGQNKDGKVVIRVIEIIPEVKKAEPKVEKPKRQTKKK